MAGTGKKKSIDLVDRVGDFQENVFPGLKGHYKKLGGGQSPPTLFITCSDSRIDVTRLTQSLPGDVFVIRNAGNMVPAYTPHSSGEIATVEYAVDKKHGLGVQHIVVCGHAKCGAMGALLDMSGTSQALPAVGTWLEQAAATLKIVDDHFGRHRAENKWQAAIRANVLVQLANLRTHPSVASRLLMNDLQLHAWVYNFVTGEVDAFDEATQTFVPLSETTWDSPVGKSDMKSVLTA